MIDRWDDNFSTPQDFAKKLHSFLVEVSPMAGHIIFVSQVPVVRNGDQYNLRELVTWRVRYEDKLPSLYPDANAALRKQAIAIAESDTASFPNQLLR